MASSDDPITVPIERYITQLLDEVYFYKGGILLQVSKRHPHPHPKYKRILNLFSSLSSAITVDQQRSNFVDPAGRLSTSSKWRWF